MRAYLIDPMDKTIVEIGHNETATEILGYLQCQKFVVVRRTEGLYKGDHLYVDLDFDMRPRIPFRGMFSFKGIQAIIIGRGLISGHTVDGEMCDPRTPIHRVRDLISWR